MKKTDKAQFLIEIEMLGKSKTHRSTFGLALKGVLTLNHFETILADKLKVYNYEYTNIFHRYQVPHDDLHGDLGKIWDICLKEKDKKKQRALVESLAAASAAAGSLEGPAVGGAAGVVVAGALAAFLGGGLVLVGLVQVVRAQVKVRRLWNTYKANTNTFARQYVESLSKTE